MLFLSDTISAEIVDVVVHHLFSSGVLALDSEGGEK